ncbi:DoxX family protein, partial [Candidatus Woesearchaeota archaeon]
VVGLVFLLAGLGKVMNMQGASSAFMKMGFPGFFGPLVGWIELIGGVLLIIGLFSRVASFVLALVMLVALLKVHLPGYFGSWNIVASGVALSLSLFAALLTTAFAGPGKLAFKPEN